MSDISEVAKFVSKYAVDLGQDVKLIWPKIQNRDAETNKRIVSVACRLLGGLGAIFMGLSAVRGVAMFIVMPFQASPFWLLFSVFATIVLRDVAVVGMNKQVLLTNDGESALRKVYKEARKLVGHAAAAVDGVRSDVLGTWLLHPLCQAMPALNKW